MFEPIDNQQQAIEFRVDYTAFTMITWLVSKYNCKWKGIIRNIFVNLPLYDFDN